MTSEPRTGRPARLPPLPPPPAPTPAPGDFGRQGCPHPPLPGARPSPTEPRFCIPLRLPRTWGSIKGKVTQACFIKDLWTETKAGGGGGNTRVRGLGRGKAGPGRHTLRSCRGPRTEHPERRPAPRSSPRAGLGAPGSGRHGLGRLFPGTPLSACDHIWFGEPASRLWGFRSAPAQMVLRECLCHQRCGLANRDVVNKQPSSKPLVEVYFPLRGDSGP